MSRHERPRHRGVQLPVCKRHAQALRHQDIESGTNTIPHSSKLQALSNDRNQGCLSTEAARRGKGRARLPIVSSKLRPEPRQSREAGSGKQRRAIIDSSQCCRLIKRRVATRASRRAQVRVSEGGTRVLSRRQRCWEGKDGVQGPKRAWGTRKRLGAIALCAEARTPERLNTRANCEAISTVRYFSHLCACSFLDYSSQARRARSYVAAGGGMSVDDDALWITRARAVWVEV